MGLHCGDKRPAIPSSLNPPAPPGPSLQISSVGGGHRAASGGDERPGGRGGGERACSGRGGRWSERSRRAIARALAARGRREPAAPSRGLNLDLHLRLHLHLHLQLQLNLNALSRGCAADPRAHRAQCVAPEQHTSTPARITLTGGAAAVGWRVGRSEQRLRRLTPASRVARGVRRFGGAATAASVREGPSLRAGASL